MLCATGLAGLSFETMGGRFQLHEHFLSLFSLHPTCALAGRKDPFSHLSHLFVGTLPFNYALPLPFSFLLLLCLSLFFSLSPSLSFSLSHTELLLSFSHKVPTLLLPTTIGKVGKSDRKRTYLDTQRNPLPDALLPWFS